MYKPFNKLNMSENNNNDGSKKNKGFGPQKPDGDFDCWLLRLAVEYGYRSEIHNHNNFFIHSHHGNLRVGGKAYQRSSFLIRHEAEEKTDVGYSEINKLIASLPFGQSCIREIRYPNFRATVSTTGRKCYDENTYIPMFVQW